MSIYHHQLLRCVQRALLNRLTLVFDLGSHCCHTSPVHISSTLYSPAKTYSTSHSCRARKKNSPYSSVDNDRYSSLVNRVISKVSSQTPEMLDEENERLYGPVIESPKPSLRQAPKVVVPKIRHPLLNPDRNYETEDSVLGPPTEIKLQRGRNGASVPSVTRILQQTMSPEQLFYLERWKRKMIAELGEEGFKEYTQNLFRQGHIFHSSVEEFLRLMDGTHVEGTEPEPMSERHPVEDGYRYMESIRHVLEDIREVRVIESVVQHRALGYLGIVDCVAYYRGVLCVIDWKTSEKPKPFLNNTYDNPLQVAAYVGALNNDDNYSYQVEHGLIVVAYKDGSPAHPHALSSEKVQHYWDKWLIRLEEYTEKK